VLLINPLSEELVCKAFEDGFGLLPTVYHDARTGTVSVSVYSQERGRALVSALERFKARLRELNDMGVNWGGARIRTRHIRREDWAESWKRHFKPLDIAGHLLIKPSWSRRRSRRRQAVVVLDPGLSFGTGQHATTLYCLRQLVRLRIQTERQSMLDVGTGSGILAISAAKLGYRPVVAFDFDRDAVRVAGENAATNKVANEIELRCQDVLRLHPRSRRGFSVICANLTFDLLIAARARLVAQLAPGGVLVLAGILRAQFPRVFAAFEAAGLKLARSHVEREWKSGAFLRPT
jgi:ribosomal protein L11 methyltransferase